jgi:hypothetical protein
VIPDLGVAELNAYYAPEILRWAAITKALGMKEEN